MQTANKIILALAGIIISTHSISAKTANQDVRCVQAYLTFLGYDAGPTDGLMGRRTKVAAQAYGGKSATDLPAFSEDSAATWCALAEKDHNYTALKEFKFDGRGVLPRDVAFKALQAPLKQRKKACGFSEFKIGMIENLQPITRISGINSRQDNKRSVEGAFEAERFTGDFSAVATWAFVTKNAEMKTRLTRLLAKWAKAGAFLKTINCVSPKGGFIKSRKCTQWRRSDGQDISGIQTASHSTFLMAALVRAYMGLLAQHEPDTLKDEHAAINKWITRGFARRLKRPSRVYFGLNMGWYWPAINLDFAAGRTKLAVAKLKKVQQAIDRQMYSDGSIKDRTTRGDRALWYHYTSIGEVVMSLEMMRSAGVTIRPSIEAKLHKAVKLFLRTVDDYSVIHPWAKKRHNSSYKNRTQRWSRINWPDKDFAGSWLHVYPYRYPNHPNSKELMAKVKWYDGSASKDIGFGIGVGCIYNLAGGRIN